MQPDPVVVAKLFDVLARKVHTMPAARDLTASQWAILRHLKHPYSNGRTAEQMASYFSEPAASMKLALTSLVRKGLLESDSDADDVNERYALTDAGEGKLANDPIAFAANAIAKMSIADQAEFGRLLEEMLTALTIEE
jgi:DNA-binding MarR family transcriptional regulator